MVERRNAPRAQMPGLLVTYEGAAGDRVEADTLDLAPGGLFVRTTRALGVGKRLALDLRVPTEPSAWSALGRVVWVRDINDSLDRPQGMGVKLIDADDALMAALERMVEDVATAGEHTQPGVGLYRNGLQPTTTPGPRSARSTRTEMAPAVVPALIAEGGTPGGEETAPVEPEPSIAIDLVGRGWKSELQGPHSRASAVSIPDSEPAYPVEPSWEGRGNNQARRSVVLFFLVLTVAAAAAFAYARTTFAPGPAPRRPSESNP